MTFNQMIFQKYRFFCVLLLSVFITGSLSAQKRIEKKSKMISAIVKVVDDNGKPVSKAKVVVGEGVLHAETGENGEYSFMAYPEDFVSVSAPGFEKNVSLVQDILQDKLIKLKGAKLFMTSDDNVPLPYQTMNKRFISGSTDVINSDQLEKYPSTDLRNAFTGLVPGLQITERYGSSGLSAEERMGNYRSSEKINVTSRGGSMRFIIDDVPVDITEMPLDPQEIESVSVIKDIAAKAMFGPMGADGIIYIKTKRGRINERVFNVNVEAGVSIIDRFPEWVSGADYATLNNTARQNDGLPPLYNDANIAEYAKNDPYNMYRPSINFRGMSLKDTKSFKRVNVSSSGGNNTVQYSSYLGYDGEGDIYKIGSGAGYDRITARSNIDMKINDFIKVQFDISAGLSNRSSPNYGYTSTIGEGGSQMDLLELSTALPEINNTPPIAFPVYANNDPTLAAPWYGVSSLYRSNPIAALERNGYYNETERKFSAKIALNYDMSKIAKGLSSRSFLSYDALNLLRMGKAKDYIAYLATPSKDPVTGADALPITLTKVHDGIDNPSLQNLHDYYYQRLAFTQSFNYEKIFGANNIQSSLTYYLYRFSFNGIAEPRREQLGVWTGRYTYNDKYSIQAVMNYAGTYSFAKNKRNELFPSLGASWVISEESFMSGFKFINFLKLRGEAGILGYEGFRAPYHYSDSYSTGTSTIFGPYSTGKWQGTNNETPYVAYPTRAANPDLTWETRKEYSIGLDGLMLNNKLSFEVTYYNNLHSGIIETLDYVMPYASGNSSSLAYLNFSETRYFGIEAGLKFADKAGKFQYTLGGNATVQNSRIEKWDEPQYRYSYQYRVNTAADTYRGLTYLGKFASDAGTLAVPQLFDAVLKTGDLKYKDMNGDGVVDDNDQSPIGHTTPRLYYALNADLKYKNFELSLIGTGAAFYDIPLTNSYFQNGWGDNNYSNFVKNNIGGAYPRLTYNKVSNNFQSSDFWLTKGGYFKIQNVEFAYTLPGKKLQMIHSQGVRFFVRGANLITLSKVKNVDPESIDSGVTTYPLYKTFTCGIKLTF